MSRKRAVPKLQERRKQHEHPGWSTSRFPPCVSLGGGEAGGTLTPPAPGYAGLDRPCRDILFWKAVAEMIWADDMLAMLWRALSLAAWSYTHTHTHTYTQDRKSVV